MKVTAASATHAPRPIRNRGHATPYKLVVLASDTTDAVSAAGGLIVDSIRAGWQVDVYLETESDDRALRILGAEAHCLPDVFDFGLHWPDAVVFAASTYERHRGVRRFVATATRRQCADIAAWGADWPSALAPAATVEHYVSAAAQAFKRYAMKALDVATPASPVEAFHGDRVPPSVRH